MIAQHYVAFSSYYREVMAQGGRPAGPTEATLQQVLVAAFRLLAEEGPHEVTPVRIHAETGIARTTIYRHWPTPAHVIGDILERAVARHELDDLSGDLEADLRTAVATITYRFENRPVLALFRGTLSLADGEGAPPMSQRYIAGLTAPVLDVLTTAIDNGEIDGDANELTSALCGPLFFDHLLLGQPVDHDRVERRIVTFLATNRK